MLNWYGGDIAVGGVPGCVRARKGGDFVGQIDGGLFGSLEDFAADYMREMRRTFAVGAFAGVADFIYKAKHGERRLFRMSKDHASFVANKWTDPFYSSNVWPTAGAAPAAAPGGTIYTDASAGAMAFTNPDSGKRQYFGRAELCTNVSGGASSATMLYDRLMGIQKTMNSNAAEAVTGVPTRYQSTTSTDDDYIGNNFAFPTIRTVLPATAHNHTVCQYLNQAGATSNFESTAGLASGTAGGADLALSQGWFMRLAAGDVGVGAITQLQTDVAVATGQIDFVIGHPIAWLAQPKQERGRTYVIEAIGGALQLERIMDDACLTFLTYQDTTGGSGNPGTYGSIETVIG